jgi:predicted MPP superfamily phosphohydrolase
MELERFLLGTSFSKNMEKVDELYKELYIDELHTSHPMELYRYIDLEMDNKYEIHAISDLHADVRRFLEILKLAEFINDDVDMAYPIKNLRWNPKMTDKIIVICGDIIDGKRGVDNSKTTNCDELLIHMLIFNLRILARAHNSYVFCTMGNHDFFAFHATNRSNTELAYKNYIDSRSLEFYESRMRTFLMSNVSSEIAISVENETKEMDLIYIFRAHLLSRFYLIGFPPFLKINKTLFAHAGFHIETNVFSLFEENSINSQSLQPHSLHRSILEALSIKENIADYLINQTNENIDISYSDMYNNIIDNVFPLVEADQYEMLIKNIPAKNVLEPYRELTDRNKSLSGMFEDFLLTRKLQKDCGAVDEILMMYGCNSLVVGHCPTCIGHGVFDPKNTIGITSCDDARIVYSCNSNLVTVDIAMSSAFSPNRKFLELLKIVNMGDVVQNVFTMRYYLDSKIVKQYNEKVFDGEEWMEIPEEM